MNRNLLIVLRTCSVVPLLHGSERYIKTSKHELINFCMSSLINSINQVNNNEIKLIVLDDHSSEESKLDFRKILSNTHFDNEFIEIHDGQGPSNSAKKVYEIIEKNSNDLWYHVEDDYLHFPTAIQEMIDSISYFEKLTKLNIGIFPYDCYCRYTELYPSYIFHGSNRHYRTVRHTTYTCMTSRRVFDKYRTYFDLAAEYVCQKSEEETINNVWRQEDVVLLSPIPSLAMHIVGEEGKDPYINVEKLWNETPKLWT